MPIEAAPLTVPGWPVTYGPTDGIGVLIGDILMHAWSGADPDAHGIVWLCTGLDGWFDGWDTGGGITARPSADGAWTSPVWAGPRVVHVPGSITAVSGMWDDVTRAWDRLLAVLPPSVLAQMTVSTGEGSMPEQTAMIRRHEKPILSDRIGGRAKFSLSLVAPDPRKYAVDTQTTTLALPATTGGVTLPLTLPFTITASTSMSETALVNDGNATTYPTLQVVGPCPPCTITNVTTGEQLRIHDAVGAGETLVIDVAAGTATVGGQARWVTGLWWGMVPGTNTIAFRASSYDAAAQLVVSFRSAWQ